MTETSIGDLAAEARKKGTPAARAYKERLKVSLANRFAAAMQRQLRVIEHRQHQLDQRGHEEKKGKKKEKEKEEVAPAVRLWIARSARLPRSVLEYVQRCVCTVLYYLFWCEFCGGIFIGFDVTLTVIANRPMRCG